MMYRTLILFAFGSLLASCGPAFKEMGKNNFKTTLFFNKSLSPEDNKKIISQCMTESDNIPKKYVNKNFGKEYIPVEASCTSNSLGSSVTTRCKTYGGYYRDDIRTVDANYSRAMNKFESCMKRNGAQENIITICMWSEKGEYCYDDNYKDDWFTRGRMYRNRTLIDTIENRTIYLKIK